MLCIEANEGIVDLGSVLKYPADVPKFRNGAIIRTAGCSACKGTLFLTPPGQLISPNVS